MIITKSNFKQGFVRIQVSLQDDLWYLSHIITPGDVVTSKTERKIKLGDSASRTSTVRKIMVLSLQIIDVSLEQGGVLRIKGTVDQGNDEVPSGSHHSFTVKLGDEFKLYKTVWPRFMREKLDEAVNNSSEKILIVLFDRESALISEVSQQGISHLAELFANVASKQYVTAASGSIIEDILAEVQTQLKRSDFSNVVFASPSFWHAPLKNKLPSLLKKKSVIITAYGVSKSVVAKLLGHGGLKQVLSSQRMQREQQVIDLFLADLAQDKVAYGFADVDKAASIGAVDSLVVTDNFIHKMKEHQTYDGLDTIMQVVDNADGKVHLLYDEQTMKIIDGLGGIAARLRWQQ